MTKEGASQAWGKLKIRNPKHLPARSRFGEGRRNPKWFGFRDSNLVEASGVH
jgi:hypothetical protein